MSSFADDHRKWQDAQRDAEVTGDRADAQRAEDMRRKLHEHPATERGRRQVQSPPHITGAGRRPT